MLVITRKTDEGLVIADNIEITVLEIGKDRVKLGVNAPRDIKVIRYELLAAQNANEEAAKELPQDALNAFLKMKGE